MSRLGTILVVDDDTNILEVLFARLSAAGFNVETAVGGPSALTFIEDNPVDLIISDMKMPEMSGMDLFEEVQKIEPGTPFIFLTAYGTIPDAVKALKAGAVDYISKPFDGKDLVSKVNEFMGPTTRKPKKEKIPLVDGDFYWGTSKAMTNLYQMAHRVAASSASVLILGESGVGKECIAKTVHENSPRAGKPYIVVDCGSTPSGILESELFGHVKGAFTNAVTDKKGLIEAADGGTLFLDEIGNISGEMQSRLLRFLQEKTIRRVGSIEEKTLDCRVISATNSDLPAEIKEGNFREDLYYRLRVVILTIPPLRERKEDIGPLAHFFATKQCEQQGFEMTALPKETVKWLEEYHWPGNVRELKHAIEAGVILTGGCDILPDDLQMHLVHHDIEDTATEEEQCFSIQTSEKEAIIRALKQANGVQKRAAELLDISRRSIHYKIKKYNIEVSDYK